MNEDETNTPAGVSGHVKYVFKLCDTYGYPLEFVVWELYQEGLFPDWKEFIRESISANWTYDQIFRKIWHSCTIVYPQEFRKLKWAIPATYLLVLDEEENG